MLHGNMQAIFFLQNMENSGSLHGNILQDYNAAFTISIKMKTIPLLHRRDHFVFMRKILKYVPYVITVSQLARLK